jgi:hypothetical protein
MMDQANERHLGRHGRGRVATHGGSVVERHKALAHELGMRILLTDAYTSVSARAVQTGGGRRTLPQHVYASVSVSVT